MGFAGGTDLVFLTVLFLHIGGAIVAFGPTFALPIIGAMGGQEPEHANFAVRASAKVAKTLVAPLAVFQGVTGVLLIALRGWPVTQLWLAVAIVLYLIVLGFSLFVASPVVVRLIDATSTPSPPPGPGAAAPSGPPPHIAALVAATRRNGMIQTVLIVVIALLMVYKPTL